MPSDDIAETDARVMPGAAPAFVETDAPAEEGRDVMVDLLDHARRAFAAGEALGTVVDRLVDELHVLRAACPPAAWRALIPVAKAHPVREYLLEDPFTRRSFEKPRGYAGDPMLLDLLYRHLASASAVEAASEMGRAIYAATSVSSSARAVQERREILAARVDAAAARTPQAEVLAIAGGHLREAEFSRALTMRELKRWVAFDQDPAAVEAMRAIHAGTDVEPAQGSVKALAMGEVDLGRFDLVYSAGVYDYLPDDMAAGLTRRLLAMLKPGGELLFGNFSTEVVPDGYMETFMDWRLLTRTEHAMRRIASAAMQPGRHACEVYFGENRHVVYASIRRTDG